MDEDDVFAVAETPLAHLIDQTGQSLARIGGIDEDALALGEEADAVERGAVQMAEARTDVLIGHGDTFWVGRAFEAEVGRGFRSGLRKALRHSFALAHLALGRAEEAGRAPQEGKAGYQPGQAGPSRPDYHVVGLDACGAQLGFDFQGTLDIGNARQQAGQAAERFVPLFFESLHFLSYGCADALGRSKADARAA